MVVIQALLFLVPHSAQAAAGDLDSRFGNGGVVAADFAQTDDYAFGIAVQPDEKIVVSGQSRIYANLHSALAHYNRNGRLDSTFGTGGKVVVTFDSSSDYLYAPVIQSDGKIVAAGSTRGTAFLLDPLYRRSDRFLGAHLVRRVQQQKSNWNCLKISRPLGTNAKRALLHPCSPDGHRKSVQDARA